MYSVDGFRRFAELPSDLKQGEEIRTLSAARSKEKKKNCQRISEGSKIGLGEGLFVLDREDLLLMISSGQQDQSHSEQTTGTSCLPKHKWKPQENS